MVVASGNYFERGEVQKDLLTLGTYSNAVCKLVTTAAGHNVACINPMVEAA